MLCISFGQPVRARIATGSKCSTSRPTLGRMTHGRLLLTRLGIAIISRRPAIIHKFRNCDGRGGGKG